MNPGECNHENFNVETVAFVADGVRLLDVQCHCADCGMNMIFPFLSRTDWGVMDGRSRVRLPMEPYYVNATDVSTP